MGERVGEDTWASKLNNLDKTFHGDKREEVINDNKYLKMVNCHDNKQHKYKYGTDLNPNIDTRNKCMELGKCVPYQTNRDSRIKTYRYITENGDLNEGNRNNGRNKLSSTGHIENYKTVEEARWQKINEGNYSFRTGKNSQKLERRDGRSLTSGRVNSGQQGRLRNDPHSKNQMGYEREAGDKSIRSRSVTRHLSFKRKRDH